MLAKFYSNLINILLLLETVEVWKSTLKTTNMFPSIARTAAKTARQQRRNFSMKIMQRDAERLDKNDLKKLVTVS